MKPCLGRVSIPGLSISYPAAVPTELCIFRLMLTPLQFTSEPRIELSSCRGSALTATCCACPSVRRAAAVPRGSCCGLHDMGSVTVGSNAIKLQCEASSPPRVTAYCLRSHTFTIEYAFGALCYNPEGRRFESR
jgi:hypothetical protein